MLTLHRFYLLTLVREFLGQLPSAISGIKSNSMKHIQIDTMLCSGFFPQNALGDGPAFWFFSSGLMGLSFLVFAQESWSQSPCRPTVQSVGPWTKPKLRRFLCCSAISDLNFLTWAATEWTRTVSFKII